MDQPFSHRGEQADLSRQRDAQPTMSLQFILWLCWSIIVILTGVLNWRADVLAHQPLDPVALIVHCLLVGAFGLLVMTRIEMWLEPGRFYGYHH